MKIEHGGVWYKSEEGFYCKDCDIYHIANEPTVCPVCRESICRSNHIIFKEAKSLDKLLDLKL